MQLPRHSKNMTGDLLFNGLDNIVVADVIILISLDCWRLQACVREGFTGLLKTAGLR